jgi:hypothetical protein
MTILVFIAMLAGATAATIPQASFAAQTPPAAAKQKVVLVALQQKGRQGPPYLEGRLYRVGTGVGRKHIADIDTNGAVSPEVECTAGEKLDADLRVDLMMKENGPFFCKDRLTFLFKAFDWAAIAIPGTNQAVAAGMNLVSKEDWVRAVSVFTDLAATMRQAGQSGPAVAAENAAIGAAAKALGDTNLEVLVARDFTQDRRLVFTPSGVAKLKDLQAENNIRPNGQLNTRTMAVLPK